MTSYMPQVQDKLAELDADPTKEALTAKIDAILDLLASDSAHPDLRRRRFADPPVWCARISSGAYDYVVLWASDAEGEPVVHYVGDASFI